MLDLHVSRLYSLTNIQLPNYSFFYFFTFSIQENYYYILRNFNFKVSYFITNDDDPSVFKTEHKVFIIYKELKTEIFSICDILNSLYILNNETEGLLNVCL